MPGLDTDVRWIKGIGEARAKALAKLGIETLLDLISYYPRTYEDRRTLRSIAGLIPGEFSCVCAMVTATPTLSRLRRGLDLVKLRVVDESGGMDLTFFNQAYVKNMLHSGKSYIFYGRAEGFGPQRQMCNPLFEAPGLQRLTGRLVPKYALCTGLSQAMLQQAIRQGLDTCGDDAVPDFLPALLQEEYGLCSASFAYEQIHFPSDEHSLALARRRKVFEELFLLALGLRSLREQRSRCCGYRCHAVDLSPFFSALPFSLTDAQQRCLAQAIADMQNGQPMNRLCQGDVGSGKTMVAAGCLYFAAQNGLQSALMAPTELLAQQHFHTLSPLFEQLGLTCALLTGSTPAKQRHATLSALARGEISLMIGTHALLNEEVQYRQLGLVITDEQHRFGVEQRAALASKGDHPHLLVMSATPIPRTLALILYGDLDISVLDALPPGRQRIDTYLVDESYRARLWAFVRQQVAQGRQVYLICPLVEQTEEQPDERKAVKQYAKLLEKVFPDLRVAYLHGRMKAREKETIMQAFVGAEVDILISTTVVEVGVDVPNASLMLIENAERFGLSQLHQLRGRVGRGSHKSYCILISDTKQTLTRERLNVLTHSRNGFFIAEEDLRLRGPGDVWGQRQHGLPGLNVADLACDTEVLFQAQQAARHLLDGSPDLAEYPQLRQQIQMLFSQRCSTFN